ncbi:unnamed protein product [Gongylonema pulchrum]|uniref:Uncharacterized protein n=1 Tax=Gongylonema pulchrum TaxID=637853 RepID=A0A183E5B5_9BILA|nr:unnamed protein product [Gongylonema pulchrum]
MDGQAVTVAAKQPSFTSNEEVDMRSAVDEHISTREYILNITDEALCALPVAYIESFYSNLSPGEIMQLEQRLCDLRNLMSYERQHIGPLPVECENFLKSYHPQIFISTADGFRICNRRGNQNGLDIRQLILAAKNGEFDALDSNNLRQLQPFLSIIEFRVCFANNRLSNEVLSLVE